LLATHTAESIGPLPQGTYTFEIYWRTTNDEGPYQLRSRQPLVISPPVVPAGSPATYAALIAALVLAAFLAMRRIA